MRGDFTNGKGRCCALGACRLIGNSNKEHLSYTDSNKVVRAEMLIGEAILGNRPQCHNAAETAVIAYNDNKATHHKDILKVFRKAIKKARLGRKGGHHGSR